MRATTAVMLAIASLIGIREPLFGQGYGISPVWIDLSPAEGIRPDGLPEFMVNREVIDQPYQGTPAGTQLITQPGSPWFPGPGSRDYYVTVRNLTAGWLHDAVLTVENYSAFYGDPTHWIFLRDVVWNPPALATGDVPAYPLGNIPPGGEGHAMVRVLPGFEPYGFDGQFNAGSIGFDSYPDVPAFSDASVLFVPEPAALVFLVLGGLIVVRRRT